MIHGEAATCGCTCSSEGARVEGVEVNREEGDGAFDYFSEDIMTQSRHLPGDGTWMPPEGTC